MGTEAGAPPITLRGIELEGHRPRCPRVQISHACDVAGCGTGTEVGAPPMTLRGIQLEGHRPRCPRVRMFDVCDVAGSDTGTEAGAPPGSLKGWGKSAACPGCRVIRVRWPNSTSQPRRPSPCIGSVHTACSPRACEGNSRPHAGAAALVRSRLSSLHTATL